VTDQPAAPGMGEGGGRRPTFRGVTQLTLDAKGRLAIPTRHREGLAAFGDGGLVLTADPSRCLLLYPLSVWEPIEDALLDLPAFDEHARARQRLLVGHATQVEIDAAGRILIPPELRQYARLDRQVALVGQGKRFELWDNAKWDALTEQTISLPPGPMSPGLANFRL
jgi:MraZ protein